MKIEIVIKFAECQFDSDYPLSGLWTAFQAKSKEGFQKYYLYNKSKG